MNHVFTTKDGIPFEDERDRGRLIVSGEDTGGQYSLLEWSVAANEEPANPDEADYGLHLHRECEETFLIKAGSLEFFIEDRAITLNEGDFVRVPPGVCHGYQNKSGRPVEMLVSFFPAGFETLFVKYRTDQALMPGPGFIEEATRDFASEFGLRLPD